MDDLTRLRTSLQHVEQQALSLPWSKTRHWRTQSHVGLQGKRPTVDLHDLSVRLALEVLHTLERQGPNLQAGCVTLITGRGRHTGGRSVLRDAILARLQVNHEELGWRTVVESPARVRVELDAARARASAPGLGVLFWGFVSLVLGALAAIAWYR